MTKKQKKVLYQIIAAVILIVILKLLPAFPTPVELVLYLIPYLVVGWDVLRKALKGIKNRQPFDECFLMAVATVGAFALGDYVEGCAVILFYQIGELFQSVAVGKSRQSISSLMDIRPDYANIEDADGKLEQVDPDDVEVGTVIVVQPGERVPIDGVIVEGISALNTAALTGESLPRDVQAGDEVISGCVNMTGLLKVRTTKEFGESTVSKILDLVENSSMKKARTENFITRFARVYTPAVCYGALALAFIPPIVLLLILCGMVLWVIAMPGGALLLWHYLGTGVQVGSASFNMVHLILIVSVFYITRAAITASRSFLNRVASQSYKIDKTLIPPMQTGITYGLWTLFALFTLKALGFGLENLAVIAGGLSVGIGFGMQTIVNNFLSGLILIFSRTLHEGDVIDVAFQLERNDFNGMSSPQLVIQDVHLPGRYIVLNRAVMVDIYMALKKCIPDWGMPVWQVRRRLAAAQGDCYDVHTIYAAIVVLREIGVLKIRHDDDGPAYYFPILAGKMDLHASPTYELYCKE